MDLVLRICDNLFLDRFWAYMQPLHAPVAEWSDHIINKTATYPMNSALTWSEVMSFPPLDLGALTTRTEMSVLSSWPRDYVPRQLVSLIGITLVGIMALYFIFAWLSYYFIFNHEMMKHPRFLKNQIRLEIICSLKAFPGMTLLTLPWFQAEVMGYSRMYTDVNEYGWPYLIFSSIFFLVFTDYCIYWVHRWLHLPIFYKHIHKPHHKWIIPTPFASHAFHPVDGYFQSVPYHLFVFLFPLHQKLYLVLFVAVNFWSIFIHDSDMVTGHWLENVINGPAHHTLHHLYFTVNYGQYFTWADRFYKSYRHPQSADDPLLEVLALEKSQQKEKSL